MENITDADFESTISSSDIPILVDFWAEWCMPCKMIIPALEELSSEYEDKIKIIRMNVDENTDTPQKFGITGIPTLIIFKNNEAVETLVGALPKPQLEEVIKKHI